MGELWLEDYDLASPRINYFADADCKGYYDSDIDPDYIEALAYTKLLVDKVSSVMAPVGLKADIFKTTDWTGTYETIKGDTVDDNGRMACQNLESPLTQKGSIRYSYNAEPVTPGKAQGVWAIVGSF